MKEKESDENTGFGVFKQTKGGKLHNFPPPPPKRKETLICWIQSWTVLRESPPARNSNVADGSIDEQTPKPIKKVMQGKSKSFHSEPIKLGNLGIYSSSCKSSENGL